MYRTVTKIILLRTVVIGFEQNCCPKDNFQGCRYLAFSWRTTGQISAYYRLPRKQVGRFLGAGRNRLIRIRPVRLAFSRWRLQGAPTPRGWRRASWPSHPHDRPRRFAG